MLDKIEEEEEEEYYSSPMIKIQGTNIPLIKSVLYQVCSNNV